MNVRWRRLQRGPTLSQRVLLSGSSRGGRAWLETTGARLVQAWMDQGEAAPPWRRLALAQRRHLRSLPHWRPALPLLSFPLGKVCSAPETYVESQSPTCWSVWRLRLAINARSHVWLLARTFWFVTKSWSVAPMCPAFLLGANTDGLHAIRKISSRSKARAQGVL